MKPASFPRIWFSRPGPASRRTSRRRRRESGTAALVVVFLGLVFSGLGLGLAALTRLYAAVGAQRRSFALAGVASENGVKRAYAALVEELEAAAAARFLTDEEAQRLAEDAGGGGVAAAEAAFGAPFPVQGEDGWEDLSWSSETACVPRGYEDRGAYFGADFDIAVNGRGSVRGTGAARRSSLVARLGVAAGRLPLTAFPFLIDKPMAAGERAAFLAKNAVEVAGEPGNPSPAAAFGDGGTIPDDATGLLAAALKIKMFEPQSLTAARLRAALGLPASDDPVPEAVYLIRDDLGLGGIYVQGDVEEMVAAIDDSFQVLLFKLAAGEWIVRFSPAAGRTEFVESGGDMESFDLVPLGLVVVRGAVEKLGGGTVGADGRPVLETESETPSLLSGVRLTIVATGRVEIASHLVRQGLRWQDGIPHLEDKSSQLIIYATGKDFAGGGDADGGIVIGEGAPRDLRIDASLTAAGAGIRLEGGGGEVRLAGGLQATEYQTEGRRLVVAPPNRGRGFSFPEWAPLAERPLLRVLAFRPERWTEPAS
ncbi:MAG: hypothetical protein JW742_00060 [Candidatus Aminicenantes bacterium]|nr:hypothetical protein [Candidatus Aminicenantes bacterium]